MMSDVEPASWVERVFPTVRKRRKAELLIDRELEKVDQTTHKIRQDFNLDELVEDIGVDAARTHGDEPERPSAEPLPQYQSNSA